MTRASSSPHPHSLHLISVNFQCRLHRSSSPLSLSLCPRQLPLRSLHRIQNRCVKFQNQNSSLNLSPSQPPNPHSQEGASHPRPRRSRTRPPISPCSQLHCRRRSLPLQCQWSRARQIRMQQPCRKRLRIWVLRNSKSPIADNKLLKLALSKEAGAAGALRGSTGAAPPVEQPRTLSSRAPQLACTS